MSARSLGRRFVTGWLALVSLPPTLLHEIAHAVAAAPVAKRVALVVEPTGLHAETQIWWANDPPGWLVRLVHLVPHLGGLAVGVVVCWRAFATGLALPSTSGGLLLWSVIGLWWLQFTAPSLADLQGALGGSGGDDDG